MKDTPGLYDTLVQVLRQHGKWLDARHVKTLAWMWGEHRLYLALDTSLLWDQYCVVRISVVFRGRAMPIVWQVLAHGSSAVSYATYQELLDKTAGLLPAQCQVVV